jgi:RimJ/RimL family protein N-acetyltransferase
VFRIVRLSKAQARDILDWRYQKPYDFYNPPDDDHSERYVTAFVRPELQFHAVLDECNQFLGFCSYGIDGQVPGGDYSHPALDVGLGMKPEFTGQGLGVAFFTAILRHANQFLGAGRIRLTVADFNKRAMSLYNQFGFSPDSEFVDARNQVKYTILMGESRVNTALLEKI